MNLRAHITRSHFFLGAWILVLACAAVLLCSRSSLAAQDAAVQSESLTAGEVSPAEETSPAEVPPTESSSDEAALDASSQATRKTALPAITKHVQEDATGVWGMTADAQRGQDLCFMLTGTLPSDFDSYEHYHLCFIDSLSQGLSLGVAEGQKPTEAVTVSIDGQQVTADDIDLSIAYENNCLIINFADLKAPRWSDLSISKETVITVFYQAHLNDRFAVGMEGNTNSARLFYTKDAKLEQDSETPAVVTKVFCYAIVLKKVDEASGKTLPGAAFTVQVGKENSDTASQALYVQKDGTLADKVHQFVTDETGTVLISGLDEGSYAITEVRAPDGYQRNAKEVLLKLDARRDDQSLALTALEATVNSDRASVDDISAETGMTTLALKNSPLTTTTSTRQLPQTGVGPIAAALIAMGLITLAATCLIDARRRRTSRSSTYDSLHRKPTPMRKGHHMHSKSRQFTNVKACLGIALALGGLMAASPQAHAEGTSDIGSITITQRHNEGATYDAFMLFKADISSDDHATHVAWASSSMETEVISFLNSNGYGDWLRTNHPGANQSNRAQNACEYISEMITGSATDSGAATTPRTTAGLSFANELAQHLATKGATPRQTASSGVAFNGPEGYYLFVTTDTTTQANGEAGSAPIWVPLGGSVTEVFEKSAVPSVDKEVKEDSTGNWGKVADANTTQDLEYRLVGTLPTNYGAFDHYHYQFTDTFEQGLTLAQSTGTTLKDALHIEIGGRTATVDGTNIRASYEGNVLTVEFVDLKSSHWSGYGITKDTVITVEYRCHMNDERAIGAAGNLNSVYLTYTDDPVSNGDGRTDEVSVRVFAYKLSVLKVDEQTNEPLAGVGFTIKVADSNSDQASRGLYVQADGSLGTTAKTFTTDANGSFEVLGLDEGTYFLSEVTVPDGWEGLDEDITLKVSSQLEGSSLSLGGLTATLTGGDAADVNAASVTGVSAIDGNAGSVAINVTNDRWIEMPVTGLAGLSGVAGLGAIASVTAGTVLAVRRRKF